jgi:hypothetical protein
MREMPSEMSEQKAGIVVIRLVLMRGVSGPALTFSSSYFRHLS